MPRYEELSSKVRIETIQTPKDSLLILQMDRKFVIKERVSEEDA